MHFLDLTLGIRFEPVLGRLILIISKPNHIPHTEIACDYILFWYLSQDLDYSFDIYPHL